MPSVTVISFCVINSATGWLVTVAKRTSRLVRMPTSVPSGLVTGMPEMRCRSINRYASDSGASGVMVTGFTTMPDSNFFTRRTCSACASSSMFLWMVPMPPCCAIAIARAASVTVSIAADISGMPRPISRVSRVRVSTSFGSTSEAAGSSNTSSNVRAKGNSGEGFIAMLDQLKDLARLQRFFARPARIVNVGWRNGAELS